MAVYNRRQLGVLGQQTKLGTWYPNFTVVIISNNESLMILYKMEAHYSSFF